MFNRSRLSLTALEDPKSLVQRTRWKTVIILMVACLVKGEGLPTGRPMARTGGTWPGPCFTKGLIQALSLGSGEEQAV